MEAGGRVERKLAKRDGGRATLPFSSSIEHSEGMSRLRNIHLRHSATGTICPFSSHLLMVLKMNQSSSHIFYTP